MQRYRDRKNAQKKKSKQNPFPPVNRNCSSVPSNADTTGTTVMGNSALSKFTTKTANQALLHEMITNREAKSLVYGLGAAGTGKTLVTLHAAAERVAAGINERIIIIKPNIEALDEKIGTLPGGVESKTEPYQRSFMELIKKYFPAEVQRSLIGKIKAEHLAYVRGLNFDGAVVIADEAQNMTLAQLHLLCTRICEDSLLILIGDTKQHDRGGESPIQSWLDKVDQAGLAKGVLFGTDDVVRSGFVKAYTEAFGI